ncbi:MAG: methionyl-tRNA formyltransferase [Clostridia bacterium]|nr:methionyl-tRNA formyltransferase [Clostridia bacterium]
MRIVYMGTPEFAVPSLKRLIADGHEVSLVITQPDKPVGRKQVLTPPPVKVCAMEHGIAVAQPQSMRTDEAFTLLQEADPDVIVVAAYGKILPKAVLELPRHGCICVHASLLPAYRGAAPIQWAVLNGEREAGVTTMQMDEGIDTGDMLMKASREVPLTMTAGELHDALAEDGAALISDTLQALQNGTLTATAQPEESTTAYASMLSKALSPLDFSKPALTLHNQVRGLCPWPSASCTLHGKTLKVHTAELGEATDATPGTVCALDPLSVACGDGQSLRLLVIQYEGKQRMNAADFLRGHAVAIGETME